MRRFGTYFVLVIPWILLVWHLSSFWSVDPQYAYGWAVPIAVGFFVWRNLLSANSLGRFAEKRDKDPQPGKSRWTLAGAILSLVLLGPIWLVHYAVPDWSVVNWLFGGIVVSYLLFFLAYGWGSGVVRRLLFPVLFVLCAVPWPQRLELALVQGLMKGVAVVAAEALFWLDIPARAMGNIIRIPNGSVGIDEACSGVRSLQAMLMASLFLGELRRVGWLGRIILVLLGTAFALFFNLVRTVLLVWIAATQGFPAFERWHDPAGYSILCLSFVCLWLVSQFIRSQPADVERAEPRKITPPLLRPVMAGFTCWILFFLIGTEYWYRRRENTHPRYLTVKLPSEASGLVGIPISDTARRILLYDTAKCAAWREASGSSWACYFLVWNSGRTSTQSARIHRPENCLQGSGAILQAELKPARIDVAGGQLLFRSYIFEREGLPLYVYYLVWEEGNRDIDTGLQNQEWSGTSRLQRVWMAQRNLGQQSVEILLSGLPDEAAARNELKAKLKDILQVNS
jgi:exosortase